MYDYDYDYEEYGYEDCEDYEDDDDIEHYPYREDEIEPTWFYEWRGHFFYDKPTLKQKVIVTLIDIKRWFVSKLGGYDDIPF